MSELWEAGKGVRLLLMGNEAIARGDLEAGVRVAAGYPGTPSSEIIENLARAAGERNIYVEWSVNEKVALEVAAASSYAGLRSMAVMSHLRVSAESACSPQTPRGRAHMVVALEPAEALRVLKDYGNPEVRVICNTRPIHPIGVICGEQSYSPLENLREWIRSLSREAWFIDATEAAIRLGNPVLGNIISVGALAATGVLPLTRGDLESVLSRRMSADKVDLNLTAFDMGAAMIRR